MQYCKTTSWNVSQTTQAISKTLAKPKMISRNKSRERCFFKRRENECERICSWFSEDAIALWYIAVILHSTYLFWRAAYFTYEQKHYGDKASTRVQYIILSWDGCSKFQLNLFIVRNHASRKLKISLIQEDTNFKKPMRSYCTWTHRRFKFFLFNYCSLGCGLSWNMCTYSICWLYFRK